MSRFDFHSFVDLLQAAGAAGLSSGTIDKMSELGFESIHDAASRSHTVDAALSAEIEALRWRRRATRHTRPSRAARARPAAPCRDSISPRYALRPEASSVGPCWQQTPYMLRRRCRTSAGLLGHTTMGRKFCVSSVSLRPRKGPGRRRPRLNSPTPSRQTATTHPHRADLGAASLQPAHKREKLLAS